MAAPKKLLPRTEGLSEEFYAHCRRGELHFQRCSGCQGWRHLPREMCAACGSTDWSWQPSSGRGRIFSWTITHQAPHPAFADQVPYAVIVVELEEGVRMASGLRGLAPEELALDLPVEVVFEEVAEGVKLPYFRPLR